MWGEKVQQALGAQTLLVDGVTRYRVLLQDLHDNRPSYLRNFWDLSKIASLSKDAIVLELRAPMDRQDYTLPARQFFPPEFPYVTLR